jgi:hypothetical protein
MVNVQQQLINPSLGRTDYGVMTEATRAGLQEVLQASKEKQNRIRTSLAETKVNNQLSAQAQAEWMGAIANNPDLLAALDKAPDSVQKAYKKAEKGNAGLTDNGVILSYISSAQKQINAKQSLDTQSLQQDLIRAQILQAEATAGAKEAEALSELYGIQGADNVGAALARGGSRVGTPPVSAIDTGTPITSAQAQMPRLQQDFIPGSIGGIETTRTLPTPDIPSVLLPKETPTPAPQKPKTEEEVQRMFDEATPVSTETVEQAEPGLPALFTDSKGNVIPVADPVAAVNNPEVKELKSKGMSTGDAVLVAKAKKGVDDAQERFVFGDGNVRNLPTASERSAQLYRAGLDAKESQAQVKIEIDAGQIYTPPTSKDVLEKKQEFNAEWKAARSAFTELVSSSAQMQSTVDRLNQNLGPFTVGWFGTASGFAGVDIIPDNNEPQVVRQMISQLRSDSAITTIQDMKSQSKTGATGLGQVSVVEFTSLIEKANTVDQRMSSDEIRRSAKNYMYNRNKAAYNTYISMMDIYGREAMLTLPGVSDKAMGNILYEIDEYERTNPDGKKIAASSGKYIDTIPAKYKQYSQSRTPPSPAPTPAPTGERPRDPGLVDEAEFAGRQANRMVNKEVSDMMSQSRIPGLKSPMAAIAPPIMRLFGILPDATDPENVDKFYKELQDSIQID